MLGRFALDFVVVRDRGGRWEAYAIEINLRKGGTTHPFLTLQFLTDGTLRPDDGARSPRRAGARSTSWRRDHLESDLAARPDASTTCSTSWPATGLHFDQSRQTGVVFHMMSALTELGRVGLTAVGDTPASRPTRFPAGRADPARGGRPAAAGATLPA